MGEFGGELVEDRLAPAGGHPAAEAGHDAAEGIAGVARGFDGRDHARRRLRIGAAHGGGVHRGAGQSREIGPRGREGADGFDPGDDFHGVENGQHFFRDGTGGDARGGFAGGGAAAAGAGPQTVFLGIGEVGVGRPRHGFHFRVVAGLGVGVGDGEPDGGAESQAALDAGEEGDGVRFLAGSVEGGGAGAAAVELRLDVFGRERDARRAAVDDAADGAAVRLAERGDAEKGAEGAGHGRGSPVGARVGGWPARGKRKLRAARRIARSASGVVKRGGNRYVVKP